MGFTKRSSVFKYSPFTTFQNPSRLRIQVCFNYSFPFSPGHCALFIWASTFCCPSWAPIFPYFCFLLFVFLFFLVACPFLRDQKQKRALFTMEFIINGFCFFPSFQSPKIPKTQINSTWTWTNLCLVFDFGYSRVVYEYIYSLLQSP